MHLNCLVYLVFFPFVDDALPIIDDLNIHIQNMRRHTNATLSRRVHLKISNQTTFDEVIRMRRNINSQTQRLLRLVLDVAFRIS